jgi:hypothetical protein
MTYELPNNEGRRYENTSREDMARYLEIMRQCARYRHSSPSASQRARHFYHEHTFRRAFVTSIIELRHRLRGKVALLSNSVV